MKILLVCNYFQPKLSYAESEIAKSLKNLGHTVSVITSDRYFPFPNYKETVEKVLGKRIVGSYTKKINGIEVTRQKVFFEFFARAVFFGIHKKIDVFKPDCVIVFGLSTPSCIQVSLSKPKNNFRFIGVDSHLPSELFSSQVTIKKAFYFFFRLIFSGIINKNIDKTIAVQEGTKEVITKYYGIEKNVTLVSHGTDTLIFQFNKEKRNKIRTKYKLKKNDFLIIYTGKIIESKGVDILVSAFNLLSVKYQNIYLLLVGGGTKEYIQKCIKIAQPSVNKKIIWESFKKYQELPAYYSASEVAVWPLQESLSMNDAAACSVPYIVNDTVGVKERLSNNNALLYKKGSAKDLAQKIEVLYKNSDKRINMGRNGRTLVENKLSWQKVAQRYIE